jgi:mono/diheme cytochrome c family protein
MRIFLRKLLTVAAVFCALLSSSLADELSAAQPAEAQPAEAQSSEAQSTSYPKHIAKIFASKCAKCHGNVKPKAELDLSNLTGILRGGESGEVVVAGKPDESLLVELIDDEAMPPEGEPQLTELETRQIREWIEAGRELHVHEDQVDQHAIEPLLWRRCMMCHGGEYQEGGLDLRTRESIFWGGESGPSLVLGSASQSRMIARIRDKLCPPPADLGQAGIEPMNRQEVEILSNWIDADAPYTTDSEDADPHDPSDVDSTPWGFRPVVRPKVPGPAAGIESHNAIDRFLGRRLADKELTYSPVAAKETLLRRLSYDLLGLPPTPEEVRRFLDDDRPGAYERLVDRLLASPRYGERWGRHWLDLAGYADSEGKRNADTVRPWAWRYRDYVIRAMNDDKPYDEFLFEQIAGDEMVDYESGKPVSEATLEKLVATGFLRMAPDGTSANPVNRFSDRIEVIADEVDVLGRGVLGLTLNCARCHSHKYDPISQREYYQFVAIFRGAYDEYDWMVPQPFGNQWKQAKHRFLDVGLATEWDEFAARNKQIDAKIETLMASKKAAEPAKSKTFDKQITALKTQRLATPKVRALWDRGRPSPTYLYRRGDETQPTRPVEPDVPDALALEDAPFAAAPIAHRYEKTGRRTALAKWLVHEDNPLVARVIVNRLWRHHFATGIVKSVDNFGALGTPPSHPELLDWLAKELQANAWSLKRIQRLIVTSRAYRQSSRRTPEHMAQDPENLLVSRMPMRRLAAEEVRDTILQLAGQLSLQAFGRPDAVTIRKDGFVSSVESPAGRRRSIFVRQRRKEMPTILETFDLPQMNPNCVARMESTVVSQPLYLWNSQMVYNAAQDFALDVSLTAGSNRESQLNEVWLRLMSRTPTEDEKLIALEAFAELEEQWREAEAKQDDGKQDEGKNSKQSSVDPVLAAFCHTLLNSAEALFVD